MNGAIYVECISKAFHLCLLQKIDENIKVSHSDGTITESELLCQPWTEEVVASRPNELMAVQRHLQTFCAKRKCEMLIIWDFLVLFRQFTCKGSLSNPGESSVLISLVHFL